MTVEDRPTLDGPPPGMTASDVELLDVALKLLDAVYQPAHHEVVAALRTADGGVHLGVHIEASVGRASLCAEGSALSAAVVAGAGQPVLVDSMVSVLRRRSGSTHLIEPCGVCAELLSDIAPDARTWVAVGDGFGAIAVSELLPAKRLRRDRFRAATQTPRAADSTGYTGNPRNTYR